MDQAAALLDYVLRLADTNLVLGQRLAECCGHAPELELDIALTNISLDLMGQARSLYQYAAELKGQGCTEDDLAYLRTEREFRNPLLVEYPNEDFAYTILRQFLFDAYNQLFYQALQNSSDARLAEIARKSIKEIRYHLRFSAEWCIRLGDGTELSRQKMQTALDDLWDYSAELCTPNATDQTLLSTGISVDLEQLKAPYFERVEEILTKATLEKPNYEPFQQGGKEGSHTEFLGHLLAELQVLQRTYPGAEW